MKLIVKLPDEIKWKFMSIWDLGGMGLPTTIMMFRNKKSVLCLVAQVFCVTLTPALYHFNSNWCANFQCWSVDGILSPSQIYISDLKGGAKVGVHRFEIMFNITWHLCQTVLCWKKTPNKPPPRLGFSSQGTWCPNSRLYCLTPKIPTLVLKLRGKKILLFNMNGQLGAYPYNSH